MQRSIWNMYWQSCLEIWLHSLGPILLIVENIARTYRVCITLSCAQTNILRHQQSVWLKWCYQNCLVIVVHSNEVESIVHLAVWCWQNVPTSLPFEHCTMLPKPALKLLVIRIITWIFYLSKWWIEYNISCHALISVPQLTHITNHVWLTIR